MSGQEDLQLIDVGGDTSQTAHSYGIEWNDSQVNFYIDQNLVRTKALPRALKPLRLAMSVWTTSGGWPGLKMYVQLVPKSCIPIGWPLATIKR